MQARRPRHTAWITWLRNLTKQGAVRELQLALVDGIQEPTRAKLDEGREDRTQIEDVLTVPKTDHKVSELARYKSRTRVMRTNTNVREAIPGIGVLNTGTVLASSCRGMLLDVTLSAHSSGRRAPCKILATNEFN